MWDSLKAYVVAVAQAGWYLGFGLVAGLAGLVLDISGGAFPQWVWEVILGGVFLLAPLRAFHRLRMEKQGHEAELNEQFAHSTASYQERMQALKDELEELQLRVPKLQLHFADGPEHSLARVIMSPPFTLEHHAELMKEIRQKYPKWPVQQEKPPASSRGIRATDLLRAMENAQPVMQASSQDIRRYNERLEEFYGEWEEYLKKRAAYEAEIGRTVVLELVLSNVGLSPAEDIDAFVTLVGPFAIIEEDDYPELPKAPEPPTKPDPRPLGQYLSDDSWLFPSYGVHTPAPLHQEINVFAPEVIVGEDTHEVRFHVRRLKHNLSVTLDRLYLVFESVDVAASFEVPYRMNIGNRPRDLTGVLRVVVQK